MNRHSLFCYGTLCIPAIMQSVSGRQLAGIAATLDGFERVSLHGQIYPAIIPQDGAQTVGVIYSSLTENQLRRIDRYEGRQYKRTAVQIVTATGAAQQAWTYVLHPRYYCQTQRRPWSVDEFQSRYQNSYMHRQGW